MSQVSQVKELVQDYLGSKNCFISYNIEKFLNPGANYASTMVIINIKYNNEKGDVKELSCVAKMGPPSVLLWKLMNTDVTFKKEVGFYKTIVPILNEFGQNRFDFFPKCCGSRLSLNNTESVDKDCLLLLENLKIDGYDVCNRVIGFDKLSTEMILRKLAIFHAFPIAYKIQNPNDFNKTIKPLLNKDFFFKPSNDILNTVKRSLTKISISDNLIERVEKAWNYYLDFVDELLKPTEPFATMGHHDFWINNVLIKFKDDNPINCKMIDFQMLEYSSPAHDLILFLFTSVRQKELEKYYNHFLETYYKSFIEILTTSGCDVNEFSFQGLCDEIKKISKYQFAHIMFIMNLIYTKEGIAKELPTISCESDIFFDEYNLHDEYFSKLEFVVNFFAKEEWL